MQAIIDNKDNPDADLSLVYPEEGAVWLPAGVAIVKNAPNMDNAKLFVDYVLSEEAQTALSKDHHPRHHDLHRTGLAPR